LNPVAIVDVNNVLAGKTITNIRASIHHNIIISSDGRAFLFGSNDNGQLGDGSQTDRNAPVAIVDPDNVLLGKQVIDASGGNGFTILLTSNGTCVSFGLNNNGQLGVNSTASRIIKPGLLVDANQVIGNRTIVALSSGYSHSVIRTSDGSVFTFGDNQYYQLGDGNNTVRRAPVAIVDTLGVLVGKTVVSISAGYDHTLLLTSDGAVFSFGFNDLAQLGENNTVPYRPYPVRIVDANNVLVNKTVTQISAGNAHSLLLTSDGTALGFGSNSNQQVGTCSLGQRVYNPTVIRDENGVLAGRKILQISAGISICMILLNDNSVVSFGQPAFGSLGTEPVPTNELVQMNDTRELMSSHRVISATVGLYSSVFVTDDGKVYTAGYVRIRYTLTSID
jgi:alpha-tubulin suppressor-like RCC1 family protein